MNITEFLGFLAMLLFLLISGRNSRGKQVPTEIDRDEIEQAERLKEYLQGVKNDMKYTPAPIPIPPKPQKEAPKWEHSSAKKHKAPKEKHQLAHRDSPMGSLEPATFSASQDPHKDPYAIKRDAYVIKEKKRSRAYYLQQRLKTPQDMVLWHEIIGPPKALKDGRSKNSFVS